MINRSLIFFSLVLLLLGSYFAGCGRVKVEESMSAAEQWAIAKAYFENENYLDAIDVLTAFTLNYSNEPLIDSAQFLLAESHFALREYILAASEYSRLVQNIPGSPLVDDAWFKIILCNFYLAPKYSLDQEYTEKTINTIKDFLSDYPDADVKIYLAPRANMLQTLGKVFTLGLWHPRTPSIDKVPLSRTKVVFPRRKQSFARWLLRVMTVGIYKPPDPPVRLPPSQQVDGNWVVRRVLAECRSRLAQKNFKVGELYYRLQKYPSAVIYFDSVLELYEDTPWASRALRLKGDSLFAMHKYAEAANAYEQYLEKYNVDDPTEIRARLEECRMQQQETTAAFP